MLESSAYIFFIKWDWQSDFLFIVGVNPQLFHEILKSQLATKCEMEKKIQTDFFKTNHQNKSLKQIIKTKH